MREAESQWVEERRRKVVERDGRERRVRRGKRRTVNKEGKKGEGRDEVRDERWDGEEGVLENESGGLSEEDRRKAKVRIELNSEVETKEEGRGLTTFLLSAARLIATAPPRD